MLFDVTDTDRRVYDEELRDFLPERMIDIHTHIWLDKLKEHTEKDFDRVVSWPHLVAKENPIEDLQETYRLMFPGKQVGALCFSLIKAHENFDSLNEYVSTAVAGADGFEGLLFSPPWWSAQELERRVKEGGFLGIKVYLNLSPNYLPREEVRIYDFLTREHLEVIDRHGWIVMLHIPRDRRLKDPVNLAQMVEIDERYPNARVIIAHVGRAYCESDVDNAFDVLKDTKNLVFDFSANTNQQVFERLIRAVGPKRILFGSDLPIVRMRMKRICVDGRYVNMVPPGMYGDVSGDPNMGEVDTAEADQLTFFLYEELRAFRHACISTGLDPDDLEDIFYENAAALISGARGT